MPGNLMPLDFTDPALENPKSIDLDLGEFKAQK
jgi:hypothetical protein